MQTLTETKFPIFNNNITIDVCNNDFGIILRDTEEGMEHVGSITINDYADRIEVDYIDAVIALNTTSELIDFLHDL